ncbi:MAG: sensor histidine kinase [Verrucomicrobia bacterium]|nr:sensor histidine kinase [Verrucomicrobiota bacterium]
MPLAGAQESSSLRTNAPPPPIIRAIREVLDLSSTDLARKPPVEVRAVVICFDPDFKLFFVHDGTGSIYVHNRGPEIEFAPGQLLEIKGAAAAGRFSPILDARLVTKAGTAPLPPAQRASDTHLVSGRLDAQWVETAGVVRSQTLRRGRLYLKLASGPLRFSAYLQQCDTNVADLVNSRIAIRGLAAVKLDNEGGLAGFQLFANSLADVQVLTPSPSDAASAKPRPAKELHGFGASRLADHRVRAQGLVVARGSRTGFLLQDPTGTIEVQCLSRSDAMPGDVVDATGFLSARPCPPRVEDAVVRKIGEAEQATPFHLAAGTPLRLNHQNTLVETEAELVNRAVPQPDLVVLTLRQGSQTFQALLFATNAVRGLARLQLGSRLLVAGLCRLESEGRMTGDAGISCEWCGTTCLPEAAAQTPTEPVFNLWLRSPADVRVVRGPAVEVTRTDMTLAGLVAFIAIAAPAGVIAVAMVSRRRRRELEGIMRKQMALQAEVQESEQQVRRSLEERERLAQDLHDDLIQSIYSVGLRLEDCRRQMRVSPETTENRLASSVAALNDIIRNVRNFISGLETKILNGREFRTALKSLALTTSDGPSPLAIDVDLAAAERLSSSEATQLLNIAKEAMSNSLRHARASRVSVSLKAAANGIRFEVQDDGVGFDPQSVTPRGLGLRNMASRAKDMGAEFEIVSAAGKGCSIIVTFPKRTIV